MLVGNDQLPGLVREIDGLQDDFARLFSMDVECELTSWRNYFSRSPISRPTETRFDRKKRKLRGARAIQVGHGVWVVPRSPESTEDAGRATKLFDVDGLAVIAPNGDSLFVENGWISLNCLHFSGKEARKANALIERMNGWARRSVQYWTPLLFPNRKIELQKESICWPDVVLEAKKIAFEKPVWFVEIGAVDLVTEVDPKTSKQVKRLVESKNALTYKVDVQSWERRFDENIVPPIDFSEADELFIGTLAEVCSTEIKTLLRDSQDVLAWLKSNLQEVNEQQAGKPKKRTVAKKVASKTATTNRAKDKDGPGRNRVNKVAITLEEKDVKRLGKLGWSDESIAKKVFKGCGPKEMHELEKTRGRMNRRRSRIKKRNEESEKTES